MDSLSPVLYGALIGFFVREILIYIVQEICEKMILFRCNKLPFQERSEIFEAMLADMRSQRSSIGMIRIAFTGTWDDTQPPTIQKEDTKK
jgi:hypothetical protein